MDQSRHGVVDILGLPEAPVRHTILRRNFSRDVRPERLGCDIDANSSVGALPVVATLNSAVGATLHKLHRVATTNIHT